MAKKVNQFNIVICGVGGQGLITITKILAEAAVGEGYETRTSELHGLSQRGGSVETHVRFGRKIYSPLVKQGGADLIISIEAQETLKACYYASKKAGTTFLVNDFLIPILGKKPDSVKEISKALKKCSKETIFIPATEIAKKELGNQVLAGIYLLSSACHKGLIPLELESVWKAIEKMVPQKYIALNKKTFELARKNAK